MSQIAEQSYQLVPVADLEAHPDNPRRGNVARISESIDATGFYGAVVVQASTMRILAGNHRWQAAQAKGLEQLPAIVLDVDDATARRILLADNRTADLAVYDDAALLSLLQEVAPTGLEGTGWEIGELERLIDDLAEPLDEADPVLDDGNHIQEAAQVPFLKWPASQIPLQPEEVEILDQLLHRFTEQTGSRFGFVTQVLGPLVSQP